MTCPVLAFEPRVMAVLEWFDRTYALVEVRGQVRYQRQAWPGPGSVGDQDAKLLQALDVLQRTQNDVIRAKTRRAASE